MSESGDENSPVKFVCNGRKPMAYAKETGRGWVFFFFCSSKSLCGERMREKEKKRMF